MSETRSGPEEREPADDVHNQARVGSDLECPGEAGHWRSRITSQTVDRRCVCPGISAAASCFQGELALLQPTSGSQPSASRRVFVLRGRASFHRL